jgi:hypothetical protein
MGVMRFSFTMNPELGAALRRAAAEAGVSVSAWVEEAAADRLRNQLLGEALDRWEEEFGALTEDEIAAAAEELGFVTPRRKESP